MSASEAPIAVDPGSTGSLAASLHWTQFRHRFAAVLTAHLPRARPPHRVDVKRLGAAFWAWAGVLEKDASFEALDAVDYAHFAAGQLLARLLVHRPVVVPPLAVEVEVRALTVTVFEHLQSWRRAHRAPALDDLQIGTDGAPWASFLENTAEEPELAVAFLDHFTGREPVWRYPQLISERPAMRMARHRERGAPS